MSNTVLQDVAQWIPHLPAFIPLGLIGVVSWTVWLVRWSMSRRYRPLVNDYRTSTSVVVPVYREDPDVLLRCLETWLQEGPGEIVLVVDLEDSAIFARFAQCKIDERVRVIPFRHSGKRSALGVGIRAALHDIVILTDSDTAWEPGLLAAIQMPFVDPQVGGVGTQQSVYDRRSSCWRIVADWLVSTRYLDYVPAQSLEGGVACLSGRTAAYRRSVISPLLPQLEYEYFLGRLCVSGDDGRLTWLVLSAGYKTVHQDSARAVSMFPDSFRAFVKQRVRWSRNSYRCYLTAICQGWIWRQPLVTQLTVLQILATPLSMGAALFYVGIWAERQNWHMFAIAVAWTFIGRSIRGISHLREHPADLAYLPLVVVSVVLVALPIKAWALVTMNTQGWLTRRSDLVGGEGQTDASLSTDFSYGLSNAGNLG